MKNKGPNRGPNAQIEKAKDFKGSIKRLLKELKQFKILIAISLILAALGSVLSIISPNQLSNLTDEISKGLVINTDNLETLSNKIKENLNEETLKEKVPYILNIQIDSEKINSIMSDTSINDSDKMMFNTFISNYNESSNFLSLPNSILSKLLSNSIYNGVNITVNDKLELLNIISNYNEKSTIPNNILNALLEDIEINGVVVSAEDQISLISIMSGIDENSEFLYQKLDEAPESVKTIIKPFMNINTIKNITLFLAIIYVVSALFTYIESICMTNVSNKFAKKLRSRISKKINKLPLKYFDSHLTGDVLSRVTNDVDTIAQSMNQSLASLVSALTLFIGTIIMMFVTNYIMAITAIVSSLLGFIFMSLVLGKSQKYFIKKQIGLGNLNGHIEEIYSGLNVVKAYNGEDNANKKFDELNMQMYDANRKSQFLSGLMMPMMNFIGNLGYVAVCIVGAILTINGTISFGVIVAFVSYVRLFTSPLSQIAQAMTSLQSTAAASERVFEFLDEEEMSNQKNIKKVLDKDKVKGDIEFEHVMFKYDGNDLPTIKDFSAKVKSGQKIAIVGPTGAGKTTMVNLLMKFYDINSGDIKIDGISTKDLTRENIHSLFTMVLQDTWLFNGSVKENIIYNRKHVSDERVKEVCKIVGLDHFIKTLPNGYDSIISDNDSVSAGQRQLLTIARGMIEDSPFLILDEATSNVDTRTEELVSKAMDKLTKGRTSFIIAHRLSTIKNADLILVMKDGNIIEQGNHEELIEKKGFYADLYNSQFEL